MQPLPEQSLDDDIAVSAPRRSADRPPAVTALPPSVRVYRPASLLESYVTFYYFVDALGPLTDFLYPEWGNVRFVISGEWRLAMPDYPSDPHTNDIFGPTDRCGTVHASGGHMIGFGVTPLGWHRLFGDASAMVNGVRPLADELGVPASALGAALGGDADDAAVVSRFDALLSSVFAARPADDAVAVAVDAALRQRPGDVPAFAAAAGVSVRTLHRLCLRVFGFPPKRLLRRQRFLDTLGLIRSAVGQSLSEALDADYTDQPHFYRDFRDFMGMSPRAYFKAGRVLMAQAADAQRLAGVTLSFRLPSPPEPAAS